MITIREWMIDKTILITGGAGFVGKVLVEKLLRACPGVKRIYLIIRSKGGQTPQERWAEITKDPLYAKLLALDPDVTDRKVTVLDGDISLIDLGLSQATIKELKNSVNIIFHSAATVRFNDPLHKAVLTNTRGTLELCKMATEMKNLDVFVHVSTSFCNQNLMLSSYTEKIYEPCQDWKTIIKLVEKEAPAVLNILSYKIIQDHPNTYTFSKSLSEKIVEEYSCKFKTVIARPPIVLGILVDPLPGWTDNLNGYMGLTTAVCKGIMRVAIADENVPLGCVSVDLAVNAIIICGWDKAMSDNKELSIYNCTDTSFVPVTIKDLATEGKDMNEKECTMDNDIWYPFFITVTSRFYFRILFFFLNVIPAVLLDSVLSLMKKKKRLMKITIRLYHALQALEVFMSKSVTFECEKYKTLWNKPTKEEADIFYVTVPPYIKTSREGMLIMHRGVKEFYLKEKLEDNELHRAKLRRLYYLDLVVRGILISALFTTVYKLANIIVNRLFLNF